MNSEGCAVDVSVKYAKLVKWENGSNGFADKSKPPLEILEKFGDDKPFICTFKRGDQNGIA